MLHVFQAKDHMCQESGNVCTAVDDLHYSAEMHVALKVEPHQTWSGIPRARQEYRSTSYDEKQVAPDTDKQVCPDNGRQIFVSDVGLEASANEDKSTPNADNDHSPDTGKQVYCG